MKKAKDTKKDHAVAIETQDDWSVPPGQVRRRVGDVFMYGRDKYVVESVSPSRAVARCVSRRRQTAVVDDAAQRVEPESAPATISISSCCDKQDVIDRIVVSSKPVSL